MTITKPTSPLQVKSRQKIALGLVFLIVFLSATEIGILITVKKYQPCGIGSMIRVSSPMDSILSDNFTASNGFSKECLDELESIIRTEIFLFDNDPMSEKMYWSGRIRNWTRFNAHSIGKSINSRNPLIILDLLESGSDAHCEPLGILYLAALESVGFNAREIGLFAEPGNFRTAHTTVEVFTEYGWVVQDPTFNAVATRADGSPMSAADVQAAYFSEEPIYWLQDFSITEPEMENYSVPPEELYRFIFYRLQRYPDNMPRTTRWASTFSRRLTAHHDCVLLTRYPYPVPDFISSGLADRIIVFAIIFCLCILLWLIMRKKPASNPDD